MLDGEKYVAPEAFDNLQLILSYVPRVYLLEREKGCPDERLDDLRMYIEDAQKLMMIAAAQAQATQMPGAPAPPTSASPAMGAVQTSPDFNQPVQ
jgi:hypothetical protein